jgi:hypothetical protein
VPCLGAYEPVAAMSSKIFDAKAQRIPKDAKESSRLFELFAPSS